MALPSGRLIRFARAKADAPSPAEIVAALPVATVLIDRLGLVAEVNAAAEALLGRGRAAMTGKALEALVRLPTHLLSLERERDSAPLSAYGVLLTNDRGLRLEADIALAPIAERPGWRILTIHPAAGASPIGVGTGGARAASGAAAMLAHEIKNPLSGISGAAQLLERGGDVTTREMTGLIRREAERIAALIDRMERFTAPALTLAPANIYPVLDHALNVARHGFACAVEIGTSYDPSLPAALIDDDALTQILINLLKNAAEAVSGDPRARVSVATAYRHGVSVPDGGGRAPLPIEIAVIDTGPGPPADIAAQLFQPFVSSKRAGGGLGLALVDKLVRDMGGLVQFAREGDNTVFRVLLRRAP